MYSIEQLPNKIGYENYDGIIIGFPTIHTHPTKRILNYLDGIESLEKAVPIYLYTTCGLYSANTLRIFAKRCLTKKMIPIINQSYKCAATDGILLLPNVKMFRNHEKNLDTRIKKHCAEFINKIQLGNCNASIPRFKLYSILNYPNKFVGQSFTFPIYLHRANCIKCEKCINNCPGKAMLKDSNDYPIYMKQKCEKCYRCIYHCPAKALSLSKRKRTKVTLNLMNV